MIDKEMLPSRAMVHDRLNKWVKIHADDIIRWDLEDDDETPDIALLDKARFKLTGKPSKTKKEKNWVIEFKWQSEELYKEFHWSFFDKYCTEWKIRRGGKFIDLRAAQNSLQSMKPQGWDNHIGGRDWRVRNIKTNETYLFNP